MAEMCPDSKVTKSSSESQEKADRSWVTSARGRLK